MAANGETLGLYFAQNRFYDAETHRFTQEDPVKDGENWYAYCANNPGMFVDVWGLDSYVFYDPNAFTDASGKYRDMEAFSNKHAKELTSVFGTPSHVVAMQNEDQLRKEWNKMGQNGTQKIDAVVLLCHGNPQSIRIHTNPNIRLSVDFFETISKQTIWKYRRNRYQGTASGSEYTWW